jgi:hypothetical protein
MARRTMLPRTTPVMTSERRGLSLSTAPLGDLVSRRVACCVFRPLPLRSSKQVFLNVLTAKTLFQTQITWIKRMFGKWWFP